MARLLVTGGAGFIGGNFVRHWASRHPNDPILVIDALTYAGNRSTIADIAQAELVVGDIRDTALVERLLADHRIDTIVHFAAESHVDRSIAGPDSFVETNIVGTHSLLKAARSTWLERGSGQPHRFHHISTDEVFGSLDECDPAFTEHSAYAPNSPYAASKAASDHLVRAYHRTFGLEVTTSNCSNNYGPYQYPEKLIPLFLINALHGRELPIYGDGRNRRDWLHVSDHCAAIETCLARGRVGETYNFGGGAELSNLEVADALCTAIDRAFARDSRLARRFPDCPAVSGRSTSELQCFVADRPGHDWRYAIDPAKAAGELGFAPQHGFAEGLAATVEWYLANEAWWRPLVAR